MSDVIGIDGLCAKHGMWWVKGCAQCNADLEDMPGPEDEDDPRYTLTDLGKAYRDAMQRGAKLNGGVKAGEGE